MKEKAVVVGGGVGGLAASALLARDGFDVTLLEKNSRIGGRARIWEADGFRFDMGPSWYLMPEVFDEFFRLFGREREDYYRLRRLDPAYRVFFSADEVVDVRADREQAMAVFDGFEPGGGQRLARYLDLAAYKYDVAVGEFLYRNYESIFDFFNRRLLVEGLRLNVFSRLDRFVGRFFHDRRARQILEYAMVFLGTSPVKAPALYSIMSHVDLNLGVFYPHGGLAGVAQAFGRLAEEQGVRILTDHPAERIETDGGAVRAVSSRGETYPADVAVVNADYAFAETHLLEENARSFSPRYWEGRVWAPSMFLLYIGTDRRLESLEHHNLYFMPDWNEHFDTIFERPGWPENPCFYLSCISKSDPDSAPQGGENVFVLVPVAPGLDDTEERRESYAEHVLSHVEKITGEPIKSSAVVKRIFSHRDFAQDYNASQGTALGLAHTLRQTAVFRPPLRSRKVNGLYYVGQYTHPGVGVPMVVIAARVAAGLVEKDRKAV